MVCIIWFGVRYTRMEQFISFRKPISFKCSCIRRHSQCNMLYIWHYGVIVYLKSKQSSKHISTLEIVFEIRILNSWIDPKLQKLIFVLPDNHEIFQHCVLLDWKCQKYYFETTEIASTYSWWFNFQVALPLLSAKIVCLHKLNIENQWYHC